MAGADDDAGREAEAAAKAEQNRRTGRGWLSNIDKLPEEAEPDIVWALEQLRLAKLPQTVILAEFNERLADRGIAPVSKSSWSRYSVKRAQLFRKHDEARKMSAELIGQLGPEGADEVTVMVAELIKVAMFELLEKGELGTKDVMQMARGLSSVVTAQRGSEEYRKQLKQRVAAQMLQAADRVEKAASDIGIPAARIAQLRREFLGVG